MATQGLEQRPGIERLKDGAEKLGKLHSTEQMSRRVEIGVGQWLQIEADWRTEGGTGCPLAPDHCGNVPRCQECRKPDLDDGKTAEPVKVAPIAQDHQSLEDVRTKLKEETPILAGTWGMLDGSDDKELTEMLEEGIDTVDNLMIAYFALGGEGCPLRGCDPEAVVRCKVCVEQVKGE